MESSPSPRGHFRGVQEILFNPHFKLGVGLRRWHFPEVHRHRALDWNPSVPLLGGNSRQLNVRRARVTEIVFCWEVPVYFLFDLDLFMTVCPSTCLI